MNREGFTVLCCKASRKRLEHERSVRRNTRLRLAFLLGALQQNRAQSKLFYLFYIMESVKFPTYFFPLLNSKLKREATYVPSRSMRTTSKVQSEHTQSLYYMSIRKFFTCLNHVPPIKFYFAKLYFAPSRFISS